MISVIVPVYNEQRVLQAQCDYFRDVSHHAELIFVDGGSTDATLEILADFGCVINSPKGRALHMNAGAVVAAHSVLLFHHADMKIDLDALDRIETAVRDNESSGGCLRQVIDQPGLLYRWMDQGVVRTTLINTRVKLGLMLGERQDLLTNAYRDIR